MPAPERRVLKDSLHRSVRLEIDAHGARTVVKRFASRGLAASTLDRARAAREYRLLRELSERGLPTPRALALERVDGGWEVRMQSIEEACPLSAFLSGERAWPCAPEVLARRLAELLAALHAAGVDHPDLHPGNVLIDGAGAVWAIDFHKARRVRRVRPATAWRDLASLAAGVRESTSPRWRARFLCGWLRSAPPELARGATERAGASTGELALALERRAREVRRAHVERRRARWLRASSSCRAVERNWRGFERADAREPAEFDALAPASSLASDPGALVLEGLQPREARELWCAAARLAEHGLPALRPRAFSQRPRVWLWLEAAEPGRACRAPADVRGARALHSLGRLCAQLADRGLRVVAGRWPVLWRSARGDLRLAAVASLEADPQAGDGIDLVRTLALARLSLDELSRTERAAYAAGIVAGAALGARARAELRARLSHA